MEGWLYKKGGVTGEKKRWCVLEERGSQGVIKYFTAQNCKTMKGTIKLSEMTEIEDHGDGTFDLACQMRVFHLRAESSAKAGEWVAYIRSRGQGVPSAAAAPPPPERGADGVPWMVDGVWLDAGPERRNERGASLAHHLSRVFGDRWSQNEHASPLRDLEERRSIDHESRLSARRERGRSAP